MRRLQRLGEYLRYDAPWPPALREMLILMTAQAHRQSYEWSVHEPIARREGLAAPIITAIAAGTRPDPMSQDEARIYDFVTELAQTRRVTDATYANAVDSVGEQGVIDTIGLAGYYGTLAMLMNATNVHAPG